MPRTARPNRAVPWAAIVAETVRRFRARVLADAGLAARLPGPRRRALARCARNVLTAALRGPVDPGATGLAAALGGAGLTRDEYDRLAHYLLTEALAQRLGTRVLVRVGAALSSAQAGCGPAHRSDVVSMLAVPSATTANSARVSTCTAVHHRQIEPIRNSSA